MKTIFLFLSLVAFPFLAYSQKDKIYTSLEEALKQPELVYKLDLRHNQLSNTAKEELRKQLPNISIQF